MTKTIVFIHDGSDFTWRYLFPVRKAAKLFRDHGYTVSFARYRSGSSLPDAYCGVVLHDCLENEPAEVRQSVLAGLRRKFDVLAWLDTSDSTGTTVFDVMPSVDAYLKKQLLRDVELYQQPFYSLRYTSDYYHRAFGINDDPMPARAPLDPAYSGKLQVAWNILIGDVFNTGKQFKRYSCQDPLATRKFHVSFRGSGGYIPTVDFQRQRIREVLGERVDLVCPDATVTIAHRKYLRELRNSRIVVSPFGWGEICWRDAEAWTCGAALVKPDMSHLVTWPDLYVPGTTYLPFRWDLSDFGTLLDDLLDDAPRLAAVPSQGQAALLQQQTDQGQQNFVGHVLTALGVHSTGGDSSGFVNRWLKRLSSMRSGA